jgi:serine/threonine protein kinase
MSVQHPTSLGIGTITTPSTLVIREGEDYLLEEDVQLPYKLVRNLGHGHSANVEMVEDINTGSVFARKVFPIRGSRTGARHIFDNEIKIIRRLAPHHHIIRIFATYVAKREVGLILYPVADSGDLYTFLQDFNEEKAAHLVQPEKNRVLESSFGCLASGLAFMHCQKIRHKDIKPQNILVHKGSLIYTDFGYSLDHSAISGSTTTGTPNAFTRKYCAPEVSEYGPRNSKSDIFSLGCVFLDILFVLHEELISPGPSKSYQEILENCQLGSSLQGLSPLGMITFNMLLPRPDKRPSAEDITFGLARDEPDRFCAQCKVDVRLEPQQMLLPPAFTGSLPPGSIPRDQRTPHHVSGKPSDVSQNYAGDYGSRDSDPVLTQWHPCSPTNVDMDAVDHFYNEVPPWSTVNSIPRNRRPRINEAPHKPYVCNLLNCYRNGEGYTTRSDLERHQRSPHNMRTFYKCASETCRNREHTWPYLENFKQHVHRMHQEENEEDLVRRCEFRQISMNIV